MSANYISVFPKENEPIKMYAVFTGNRFNQVLLFESLEDVMNWCRKATRWTDEEITVNIKEMTLTA